MPQPRLLSACVTRRGFADVFVRDKPHINIGTIGHVDHGEDTLARSLSARPGTIGRPCLACLC
jgi:elongation factor Tu